MVWVEFAWARFAGYAGEFGTLRHKPSNCYESRQAGLASFTFYGSLLHNVIEARPSPATGRWWASERASQLALQLLVDAMY